MKYLKLMFFTLIIISYSCINQRINESNVFNPTKEHELSSDFTFIRNFITKSDSQKLETWYASESNATFNLIYLSGNSSNIRSAVPFFNELSKQTDLNIFSFNYSGYGRSEGNPSIDGIIKDAKVALDYFEHEIGTNNLPTVILGYSLGGFVGLNIANNDIINKVVLMSTFTSAEELKEYLTKEAMPGIIRPFLKLEIDNSIYDLNNLKYIAQLDKPVLFIHGEKDDFIPSTMSYKLFNLSKSENKFIKTIPEANHIMVLKDNASIEIVAKEIISFLDID